MEIGERIKKLRKHLGLTQAEFADKIHLKATVIGTYENLQRKVNDRNIMLICIKFNVNEEWLRYGKGEMFLAPDYISLDDYARQNNLSELEIKFIKKYMSIDENIRKHLLDELKEFFSEDSTKNDNN